MSARLLAALAAVSLLAACAKPLTPEDRVAAMRMQMQFDDGRCRSYGLTPGKPAYSECRMQMDRDRQAAATLRQPPVFSRDFWL